MRVLVLGGDGFRGWPVALRLAAAGHDVAVADNFARRGADAELGVDSLTPIGSLNERVAAWQALGGRPIAVHALDVAQDHDELRDLLTALRPDAVVHLALQRAAPYSMRTAAHRRYTVDNNVSATHNLLATLVETGVDAHVVAVGREGGLGSVAHLTATLSGRLLEFYARNDGLRITDLRQGIVWGVQTTETAADDRLVNRFDYDGDSGTVLNRFLVQAAAGLALEVHGSGAATRGFVHLVDAVGAVERAVADGGPEPGAPLRVRRAVTETSAIRALAERVARLTGAAVETVADPRATTAAGEAGRAVGEPAGDAGPAAGPGEPGGDAGPDPVRIADAPLLEVVALAERYRDRIDRRRIPTTPRAARDGADDVPAPA